MMVSNRENMNTAYIYGLLSQNIAFCHKKNMTTAFNEYYKRRKKRLDYDSRALFAPNTTLAVLALSETLEEDEMRSNDAGKNSTKNIRQHMANALHKCVGILKPVR